MSAHEGDVRKELVWCGPGLRGSHVGFANIAQISWPPDIPASAFSHRFHEAVVEQCWQLSRKHALSRHSALGGTAGLPGAVGGHGLPSLAVSPHSRHSFACP